MSERPVVLVTGSRKGIGRFLVESFLSEGAQVVGCSRQEADPLPGYVHHCLDVSDEAEVRKMLASVRSSFGRLDILINNAGVASMNHALLTPGDAADRIIRTNVLGTFLVSREAAKVMMARKFGRIINLSTIAVPLALAGESLYAASKSAVETFTRILARELGPSGITVNAVGPCPIPTDLIRGVPNDKIEKLVQRLAIPRFGTYEDVAHVVRFFASLQSSHVTGQVLYLGGP
ncbi:MAG: SDR family oxidoreductase [Polyangiaceae bacterium]|nr:SDR family oxidoreductase [Polyangiaceae bacterium]